MCVCVLPVAHGKALPLRLRETDAFSSCIMKDPHPKLRWFPRQAGVTLAFLAAAASGVGAQETLPAVALDEYTVTATRFEAPARELPMNVTVLSRQDIAASGAVTLPELLSREAHVHFASPSGTLNQASVSLRGFGASANSTQRVLVLLDGVKLNPADMATINWLEIPLGSVESIEVLPGTHTALYGNHAVGGVIKIHTRPQTGTAGGSLTASLGSYETKHLNGHFSGAAHGVDASGSVQFVESDGYRDRSDYRQKAATFNLGRQATQSLHVRLGGAYSENQYDQPDSLTKAQFVTDPRRRGGNPSDYGEKSWRVVAGAEAELEDGSRLAADLGARWHEQSFNRPGWANFNDKDVRTLTFNPRWQRAWERFSLNVGGDLGRDGIDLHRYNARARTAGSLRTVAALQRDTLAGYAHGQYRFSETLLGSLGGRAERASLKAENRDRVTPANNFNQSQRDSVRSWNAGLTWLVDEAWRVWGRYDRAYRYAATDEIAYYQGFGAGPAFNQFYLNTGLKPERGHNWEAGVSWAKGAWSAGASAFVLRMKDEIGYDAVQNLNVNLDSTRRYGAEAQVRWQQDIWAVYGQGSWLVAKFREGTHTGRRIALVPELQARVGVEVTPLERLTLGVESLYRGRFDEDNGYAANHNVLTGYTLFHVSARYRLSDHVTVFGGVDNVFDKNTTDYVIFGAYYPNPGVTGKLGCTVAF